VPDDFIRNIHAVALESPLGAQHISQSLGKPYSALLQEIDPQNIGAEALTDTIQSSNNNAAVHSSTGQFGLLLEHND